MRALRSGRIPFEARIELAVIRDVITTENYISTTILLTNNTSNARIL